MAFPGSLCPAIPCPVRQRAGTETRPYNGDGHILPITLHTHVTESEGENMELLKKSVDSVIERDRIGSPVFLRCVLNVASENTTLLQPAVEIAALSNGWIQSNPQTVYAQGDANATQVTVMVKYVDGQMSVLSVNRVETETAIDIMLVGNKGVIYHETPIGRHYLSGTPPQLGRIEALIETITQALASDQPIRVEG